MLFYQGVIIDLATFAGVAILYVAYDLYVNRLQPTRSRDRTATREQRTRATVLPFVALPLRGDRKITRRNAARRRAVAHAVIERPSTDHPRSALHVVRGR
jgi:hypothetical protein